MTEKADDFKERHDTRVAVLAQFNFHGDVVQLGDAMAGVFGGINKAAVCLTCYCLVPVLGSAPEVGQPVADHYEWHHKVES